MAKDKRVLGLRRGALRSARVQVLVTNLCGSPRHVYEAVHCKRGEIENRIKQLNCGLAIDRTGCTRFFANQLRVMLTAAAYALLQEIRLAASGTALARAQVSTMRDRMLPPRVGAAPGSA